MAKAQKEMSDAEYGKHIRDLNQKASIRLKARQAVLKRKIQQAKIQVTEAEVQAELKNLKL